MLVGCGGSDSGDGGASKSGESSAKTAKVIDVDLTNEEYAFGVDKSQPELLEQVMHLSQRFRKTEHLMKSLTNISAAGTDTG